MYRTASSWNLLSCNYLQITFTTCINLFLAQCIRRPPSHPVAASSSSCLLFSALSLYLSSSQNLETVIFNNALFVGDLRGDFLGDLVAGFRVPFILLLKLQTLSHLNLNSFFVSFSSFNSICFDIACRILCNPLLLFSLLLNLMKRDLDAIIYIILDSKCLLARNLLPFWANPKSLPPFVGFGISSSFLLVETILKILNRFVYTFTPLLPKILKNLQLSSSSSSELSLSDFPSFLSTLTGVSSSCHHFNCTRSMDSHSSWRIDSLTSSTGSWADCWPSVSTHRRDAEQSLDICPRFFFVRAFFSFLYSCIILSICSSFFLQWAPA